jgi:hypothetical protein
MVSKSPRRDDVDAACQVRELEPTIIAGASRHAEIVDEKLGIRESPTGAIRDDATDVHAGPGGILPKSRRRDGCSNCCQ